ncbi:MAG: DegT/DnrJ/EryC1/StrS family aminotransferase [Victivallales bacterium]|jgi:L-glutamine:2-deoxy-scyllo-inosose/3-amino-2,3-dideoxy-scyllo-inosose aminotransferase
MSKLALLGGKPVSETRIAGIPWPPTSEKTGDKLKELYLSRNWSFNSPSEQEFEKAYAGYHGAKHGIFMVNGTVTLECGLLALGVGKGDEVIIPALTWIATATAVRDVGAKPVFVDIEPTTLCMDPVKFEEAVTPKTKAVIPVHLYGSMADMDKIIRIAKKHKLGVIEDCAHMQGGVWNGRGAGSWGDVGSFSFQQSKTVSAGESGICLTNDAELADRIYRSKHIGYPNGVAQGAAKQGPPSDLRCHNYRGNAFQALILSEQLKGLRKLIATYNRSAAEIEKTVAKLKGVRVQSRGRLTNPQGYYCFVLIFDSAPMKDIPLSTIIAALGAEGLGCGGTYGPVYKHLLFNMGKNDYRIDGGSCPVAEGIGTLNSVCISHPVLGNDIKTIRKICAIITKVVENHAELINYKPEAKA